MIHLKNKTKSDDCESPGINKFAERMRRDTIEKSGLDGVLGENTFKGERVTKSKNNGQTIDGRKRGPKQIKNKSFLEIRT